MRKAHQGIIGIIVILAVALLFWQAQPTAQAGMTGDTDIKIGVVAPLSGGPSLWGQGALNMITLAAEEINAQGGVNGKRITLIAEDGQCHPGHATTAANKLIYVDGVKFILGGHCSSETVAITPITAKAHVFQLAGVTAADGAVDGSTYAFRNSPPTLANAQKIAEVAYEQYAYRKIVTITEQGAYSKNFTQDLVQSYPGEILASFEYAPNETDFRNILQKIKATNTDAIWIALQDPNQAVLLLKQMHELGMEKTPLFGVSVFVSQEVYEKSNGLLPQNAFAIVPFADPKDPKLAKLQEKYKTRFGTDIPYNHYYMGAVYDGTHMLAAALEACGADADCVAKWFDDVEDYEGVAGTFTFDERGDPVFDSWREIHVVDGKTVIEQAP